MAGGQGGGPGTCLNTATWRASDGGVLFLGAFNQVGEEMYVDSEELLAKYVEKEVVVYKWGSFTRIINVVVVGVINNNDAMKDDKANQPGGGEKMKTTVGRIMKSSLGEDVCRGRCFVIGLDKRTFDRRASAGWQKLP